METLNCWQFHNCGRELGGKKVTEFGLCPATIEKKINGVNRGKNAGRSCWAIAGTFCGGQTQGTYAQKFKNCQQCEFYVNVKKDEGLRFELISSIVLKLRQS